MIRETFTKPVRPGDVIRGDLRIPEAHDGRSAIVVVHGFKGFKDWGFFPNVCDRLAGAGHAVVSFNFSRNGIGDDPQNFTELDRFAANTLSLELDEVLGVVDDVYEGKLLPFRSEAVGLLGHSRGGGQTVLAAAEDSRISAIATWAAVGDFDRWSAEVKAGWRASGRLNVMNARTGQQMPLDVALLEDFESNRARLDIHTAAGRVSVPWLIVHGRDDETVSSEEAIGLADRARRGELLLVGGAGHTFGARHPFASSTPELDQAVNATIGHFGRHLGA